MPRADNFTTCVCRLSENPGALRTSLCLYKDSFLLALKIFTQHLESCHFVPLIPFLCKHLFRSWYWVMHGLQVLKYFSGQGFTDFSKIEHITSIPRLQRGSITHVRCCRHAVLVKVVYLTVLLRFPFGARDLVHIFVCTERNNCNNYAGNNSCDRTIFSRSSNQAPGTCSPLFLALVYS